MKDRIVKRVPLVRKKTRSSFNASLDRNTVQCVCCEKFQDDSEEQIYRARSENCGKNLNTWAMDSIHGLWNPGIR